MKVIGVFPGTPNRVHVAELPKPSLDPVANGRGVFGESPARRCRRHRQ
jgi:hypothetical protein